MKKWNLAAWLRFGILTAVLLLAGVVWLVFGYKKDGGTPTTMQLMLSIAYVAVTYVASLILGAVNKNGFFAALLLCVIVGFPAIPFSGVFSSPLYAMAAALDAGRIVYLLYDIPLLALFGIGRGLRILVGKLIDSGALPGLRG